MNRIAGELTERFTATLSNAQAAPLARSESTGAILDGYEHALPAIGIDDPERVDRG